ncbi:MAG: PriCT-2 domain-containing protein [Candidatus Thiodiazotropha sp. (ex Epidulcina cf. delphinae)]|nr:PriCT-2 domain-containing protein [Candidatus Thiodiazotropha sp. (ex Epidulcina cf. delphinae)]
MTKGLDLTLDDVAAALTAIDPHDRHTWVQMGMAIKSEFGELGFADWDAWSSRSDKYKPRDAKLVWRSFNRSGVSIGTLVAEARRNGHEIKAGELTKEEKRQRKQDAEARRTQRVEEIERDEQALLAWNDRVSDTVSRLINEGLLDTSGVSPYLQTKKVRAYGVYFVPWPFLWVTHIETETIEIINDKAGISYFFERNKRGEIDIEKTSFRYLKRGTIVVPMRDVSGKLVDCQFIFASGKKTFPRFGRKQCLFHVCELQDSAALKQRPSIDGHLIASDASVICFAEGYATAASILQATGLPVVVTFDVGNMPPVAAAFRGVYPDSDMIFCGDDDNAGREKAEAAAKLVDGLTVFPDFSCTQEAAE